MSNSKKVDRSVKAFNIMVEIYCKNHHRCDDGVCEICSDLISHTLCNYKKCRFLPNKQPCSLCPANCYKPEMRAQIRKVMRYSGLRLFLTNPFLAIEHILHYLICKFSH